MNQEARSGGSSRSLILGALAALGLFSIDIVIAGLTGWRLTSIRNETNTQLSLTMFIHGHGADDHGTAQRCISRKKPMHHRTVTIN